MTLIIDGYNLLHASGVLGRGRGKGHLERARTALLNSLAQAIPSAELTKTTVVFDSKDPPWGAPKRINHEGIEVVFASHHDDADSYIEEMIIKNSAPRKLTVVSSDHRLHRAAKRRKATAVDSDRWFVDLQRARAARQENPGGDQVIKPEGPFTSGEVEYWLRQFGLEERK